MNDGLSKYNLDELANRVEGGSDSSAQKAEPILMAKSMVVLKTAVKDLQLQIIELGKYLGSTLRDNKKSMDELNGSIDKYSKSSDKHAKALNWLTTGLVIVGVTQIIVSIINISKN